MQDISIEIDQEKSRQLTQNLMEDPQDNFYESQFETNVQNLIKELKQFKANTEQLDQLNKQYSQATNSSKENEIRGAMDIYINQNTSYGNKLKIQIKKLQDENNQNKKQDDVDRRIQENQLFQLNISLKKNLEAFYQIKSKIQSNIGDKMKRQIKQYDSSIDDQKMNQIIQNPEMANQIFSEMTQGKASQKLVNTVSDIQQKNEDIKKLEKSIQEVYQLFVDMSLLVNQQSERLDSIELNINDAKNYVDGGVKQLEKAKESSKCTRKVQCFLLILLIIVGVAIYFLL